MKKATIRFYNDYDKYMGWQYVQDTAFCEINSWLRSGNYIRYKNEIYNRWTTSSKLKHLNSKLIKENLKKYEVFQNEQLAIDLQFGDFEVINAGINLIYIIDLESDGRIAGAFGCKDGEWFLTSDNFSEDDNSYDLSKPYDRDQVQAFVVNSRKIYSQFKNKVK